MPDRELGTSDAANNRPFTFILDSSGYNIGEVLCRREGNTVIIAAVERKGSAFVEVDLGFKGAEVLSRPIWIGEVVREQAWKKKRIFQNLWPLGQLWFRDMRNAAALFLLHLLIGVQLSQIFPYFGLACIPGEMLEARSLHAV